tara:strand:+ start:5017 stop:5505 length:489 start_codon:yes stop_codon:yes gene_type:complete
MRYLVVLKRIEIWLLLIVVAGLFVFALRSTDQIDESNVPQPIPETLPTVTQEDSAGSAETIEKDPVVIEQLTVKPTQQGKIIELTLLGRSLSGEDIELNESTLKATTDGGEQLSFFFEPFREAASLSADEDSIATVKLWLENQAKSIQVDIQGKQLEAELPE